MDQFEHKNPADGVDQDTDPLRLLYGQLEQLKGTAGVYLATYRDEAAYKVREFFRALLVSAVSLVVLTALAVCSTFLLLSGVAAALADILDQPEWVGNLLTAIITFIAVAFYFSFDRKRSKRKCCDKAHSTYRRLVAKQKVSWILGEEKDELKFLEQTRQAAINRLKNQIADVPESLEPVLSLDSWAEHHPWITVGSSALGGGLLANLAVGSGKKPDSSKKAVQMRQESSTDNSDSQKSKVNKLMRQGINLMGDAIQASLVAYASAQAAREQVAVQAEQEDSYRFQNGSGHKTSGRQ